MVSTNSIHSTIALKKDTIRKIAVLGKKGDTYDQIINKILEKQK